MFHDRMLPRGSVLFRFSWCNKREMAAQECNAPMRPFFALFMSKLNQRKPSSGEHVARNGHVTWKEQTLTHFTLISYGYQFFRTQRSIGNVPLCQIWGQVPYRWVSDPFYFFCVRTKWSALSIFLVQNKTRIQYASHFFDAPYGWSQGIYGARRNARNSFRTNISYLCGQYIGSLSGFGEAAGGYEQPCVFLKTEPSKLTVNQPKGRARLYAIKLQKTPCLLMNRRI